MAVSRKGRHRTLCVWRGMLAYTGVSFACYAAPDARLVNVFVPLPAPDSRPANGDFPAAGRTRDKTACFALSQPAAVKRKAKHAATVGEDGSRRTKPKAKLALKSEPTSAASEKAADEAGDRSMEENPAAAAAAAALPPSSKKSAADVPPALDTLPAEIQALLTEFRTVAARCDSSRKRISAAADPVLER